MHHCVYSKNRTVTLSDKHNAELWRTAPDAKVKSPAANCHNPPPIW